jgi:crotonobetainyl-CoA:carnitine CoA-transferase CaiB-like acyl-CoA transferase
MLQGLKVVELATYIAAPGAAGMLADWGADVIKVESPAGDPSRFFLEQSPTGSAHNPMFALDNRGKRGVVLDYRKPEGHEAFVRLLATADIFLTNVRPAALKRAGLDYESLKGANPRLIYAIVTGYGLTGPDADKPGFDVAAFWSRAGVGAITVPKGQEPFTIRTGMGDHVCSLATVSAILAAVVERNRTGAGRLVETSLLRAGVYAISSDMAVQLHYGKLASTKSRHEALNPVGNFYRSGDGRWICLVPRQGEKDFHAVARAVDRPDLPDDPRFAKGKPRRQNAAALVDALDAAFAALPYAELERRLDAEDVPWAPVQTPGEVIADPQADAAGCFVDVNDGQGGSFRSPNNPARFGGVESAPKGPPPAIGEHTDAILAELGFDADAIAAMRSAGAVA